MSSEALEPRFAEFVPVVLEPGVLYVSMEYATASHLCPCACGSKVVTPFGAAEWQLEFDGAVSIRPSVGNGHLPCRSHYFIRANRVVWASRMTEEATKLAQKRDQRALAELYDTKPRRSWWSRLAGLFSRVGRK